MITFEGSFGAGANQRRGELKVGELGIGGSEGQDPGRVCTIPFGA